MKKLIFCVIAMTCFIIHGMETPMESTPTEIHFLDKILPDATNLSDIGQKITLLNSVLSKHIQSKNVEKVTELLQALESNPEYDPADFIEDETIKEASTLRKKDKNG